MCAADTRHDIDLEDRIARLPLGTVTASKVGRAVVLDYLRQHRSGATPAEIRAHLIATLGWNPSDDTLYQGMLVELRKQGPSEPAVKAHRTKPKTSWGDSERHPPSPYHVETTYRITEAGLRLLEEEKKALRGPEAPLSSSQHLLKTLLPVIGPSDGQLTGLRVNVGVMLQWLILWSIRESGPDTMIGLRDALHKLCGQVSWHPPDGRTPERWPRYNAVAREVQKLETAGSITRGGNPVLVNITPEGLKLVDRWQPDVRASVEAAARFVNAAMKRLYGETV